MASISSSIELFDNMSQPLNTITNSVNTTMAAMQSMQSVIGNNLDISSFDAARNSVDQLNNSIENMAQPQLEVPETPQIDVPDSVRIPVEPVVTEQPQIDVPDNITIPVDTVVTDQPQIDVPDNMTVNVDVESQTATQQIESIEQALQGIIPMQNAINQVAQNSYVLPDDAESQISDVNGEIRRMQAALEFLRDNPFDLDSSFATMQIDSLRESIERTIHSQEQLNQVMGETPAQIVNNTSPNIPDPEPVEVPIEWKTPNTQDIFTGTGIERFQQEIQSANGMAEQLVSTQRNIGNQAARTNVFSSTAITDISNLGSRIQGIQEQINRIENSPIDFGDNASNQVEQLRSQLSQAIQEQDRLNQAVQNMDVSAANESYTRLQQTVGNTERYIRDNFNEQNNFNNAIQQGSNDATNLMNTIKGAVAAYATIESVKGIMNVSDELTMTKARIDMMNDGVRTTNDLMGLIYQSAQDARGEFSGMASVVARFGNNAKDAFSSTEEVVNFANLVQKQMTIAGASTDEAANAILQLSQALGSGVLRGDELNSIFEQAPNLIQSIADYMDVPIGKIREMAKDGELTADIVKNAVFASADQVNAKFEQMPMTWGQVWTSFQNSALMAFEPVLTKVNELANNDQFTTFVENAVGALATLAVYVLEFFDTIASVAGFISDNWSVIAPLVYGVIAALIAYNAVAMIVAAINGAMAIAEGVKAAATAMATGATLAETAAQYGLNAALLACPITWIVLAIIALIAVVIAVAQHIANMGGTATTAFGVITGGINVVIQFFKNLALSVANIALGIGNTIAALGSNIVTAFQNSIANVQTFFYNLLSTALSVISQIANALSKLPFVEIDTSGLTSAADDYAAKAQAAQDSKGSYKDLGQAYKDGASTFDTYQKGWASDAYKSGAKWGDGVSNKVSNAFKSGGSSVKMPKGYDFNSAQSGLANNAAQTAGNTGNTAANTGKIADSVDITNENLKYMRDAAEQKAINRFTTAQVSINQNNVINNNDGDVDGIVTKLNDGVNEAMERAAEGVHN